MNQNTQSILTQQKYLPSQFHQLMQNQQYQQQQLQLQQIKASMGSQQTTYLSNEPLSPAVQNLNHRNINSSNSGTDNIKNISTFGTPYYINQLQAKGNQSQLTESIRYKSQQDQVQGCSTSLQRSDNQIPSATQINANTNSTAYSSQDTRNSLSAHALFNGSLPTIESIDSQQNLGNQKLNQVNQNQMITDIHPILSQQALNLQNIQGSLNQIYSNQQQFISNIQSLQSQQYSSNLNHPQLPNNNSISFQKDSQKSQLENIFNQYQSKNNLDSINQQQLQFANSQQLQQILQQAQYQVLLKNYFIQQQQQQNQLNSNKSNQQFQLQQLLNNATLSNDTSCVNNNKQPCLVEENENEEAAEIPFVKNEHLSDHENEDQNSDIINMQTPKIQPQTSFPQAIGQISASLFDKQSKIVGNQLLLEKQALQNQFTSLRNQNQQIPLSKIPSSIIHKKSVQDEYNSDEDKNDESDSDMNEEDGDESKIQEMRQRQDQQQKVLKSLQRVYQMQLNTQKMQDGEFQSPATPQEQKNQKYITPLRLEYQKILQYPQNSFKGAERIRQNIMLAEQQYMFNPLPVEYKQTFSDNLIQLIESINKNSIIRKNPHLLYGTSTKQGRPQSSSISSQVTTRFFETPILHPQTKIEECGGSQIYANDNFSLNNGGFNLKSNLKKIENGNNYSNLFLQKNTSMQDEEFSSDSFGQNMDINPIRQRQISNISAISMNGQSPSGIRSHKQSFTTQYPNTPVLNSQISSQQNQTTERTLLNLYSANQNKDKERSKQFATAKNTQGNRQKSNTESSIPTQSPGGIQKRSKYHNLTKLFMYFLLSLFSQDNMERLGVPEQIQQELIKCVQNLKKTAKKKIKNKNLQKTDFFNHTHYNALFLHLNKNSINELQKKDKDIKVHKQCYGLDIADVDIQRLEYVNILKKFAYEIVVNTLEVPSESDCENNPRNEYMLKSLSGIRQLAHGNVIFRFQQVYGNQSQQDD